MLRRWFVLAACGAMLTACHREADEEGAGEAGLIRFANQLGGEKMDRWSPLLADLQRATGLKVKADIAAGGAAIDEALHHRRADVALALGPAALVAIRRGDAEVFARLEPSIADASTVALVANANTPIGPSRVVKCDRTFSVGAPADDRGAALLAAQTYLLAPAGQPARICFRQIRLAPAEALVDAVSQRKLDAAILDSTVLSAPANAAAAKTLRVVWRSPPLPSPSLVWRRDLDPAIKEKLRQFFLTYGQNGGAQRQRLAALGLAGFAAADNSHLLVEREMEAANAWLEARASGDKAREAQAKSAFDSVTSERADLEARTGAPAGLQ